MKKQKNLETIDTVTHTHTHNTFIKIEKLFFYKSVKYITKNTNRERRRKS